MAKVCNLIFISGEWDNYHRKGFFTALKRERPDEEFLISQYPVSLILNLFSKSRKIRKLFRNFKKILITKDEIRVYTPWFLFHGIFWIKFPFFRIIDRYILSRQITKLISKNYSGFEIVMWIYNPEYYFLIDIIPHDFLIYDYYDNYKYDINDNLDAGKEFYNNENIKRADIVITTAELMYNDARRLNENTVCITNASNASFMCAKVPETPVSGSQSIIGYVGAIKDWIDFDILFYLMENLSDTRFVFAGYVERNSRDNFRRLKKFDNFEFIGMKPPEEIFEFMKTFAVGIIPFKVTELTKGVMPIKFFDYVDANLPVVATSLPELERFRDSIYISLNKEDFLDNCITAMVSGIPETNRYDYISKSNNWKERAELFYKKFDEYKYSKKRNEENQHT